MYSAPYLIFLVNVTGAGMVLDSPVMNGLYVSVEMNSRAWYVFLWMFR